MRHILILPVLLALSCLPAPAGAELYAVVEGGQVKGTEYRKTTIPPDLIKQGTDGKPVLRPVEVQPAPAFDPNTHRLAVEYQVQPDGRVFAVHVAVPLTAQERKDRALSRLGATDTGVARVFEDYINSPEQATSRAKLPAAARAKLDQRKSLREEVGQ